MKQIMEEYGVAILEAIATVALITLFAGLVFTPGSLMSQKLMTYASGYAGEAGAIDNVSAKGLVSSSRKGLPEPKAVSGVFAGREYDVTEVFKVPDGYTLRVTRASLLDDLSDIETDKGRGNMVMDTFDGDRSDDTDIICKNGGKTLFFPSKGYYSLMAAAADGSGATVTGVYLICVRD